MILILQTADMPACLLSCCHRCHSKQTEDHSLPWFGQWLFAAVNAHLELLLQWMQLFGWLHHTLPELSSKLCAPVPCLHGL